MATVAGKIRWQKWKIGNRLFCGNSCVVVPFTDPYIRLPVFQVKDHVKYLVIDQIIDDVKADLNVDLEEWYKR